MKVLNFIMQCGKFFSLLYSYVTRITFIVVVLATGLSAHTAQANSKYASLVIDAETGIVLHKENADKRRYPASLTKMMTLYLTFEALEQNVLTMNQKLPVSKRASGQPPSKIGLRAGSTITVRDAILATTVKSANDVTVVLAEALAGTEWRFAKKMNRMAKQLGMKKTHFRNSSGLYHRKQVTNAYDMARLAVALRRDYAKYYHYFKRDSFRYKGKTYTSHNNVTKKYRGADGLKTGYIRASGFNLVTSAERDNRKVVGVVMGGRTSKRRDNHMIKLLNSSFWKMSRNKMNSNNRVRFAHNTPQPARKPIAEIANLKPIAKPKLAALLDKKVLEETAFAYRLPALALNDGQLSNRLYVNNNMVPLPVFKPMSLLASYEHARLIPVKKNSSAKHFGIQ